MKKIILLSFLLLPFLFATAQDDTWKVKLNNKTIVATSQIDEKANTRKLTASAWKKNGNLEVSYKGGELTDGWVRTFYFTDEADREVIVKDNTSKVKIKLKQLRKAFAGKKRIDIYTISRPTDPEVAMRVRLRRVHLCTLELP